MAKGMMTLKEIEDAGHLDCMMEAVGLKRESNEWLERWRETSLREHEATTVRQEQETLARAEIIEALRFLRPIANGNNKDIKAAVTNALEHLDKIHFKQFANMQFEINMQSRGE